MERWADIDGYEGCYQVSDKGNIRSLTRTITFSDGRVREFNGQLIQRRSLSSSGYYQVMLKRNGVCKYYYVHRLVASAFVPNPDNKKTVNHIDENKLNNDATNLEWATQSENNTYNDLHHRRKYNFSELCKISVKKLIDGKRKPVAMLDEKATILRVFDDAQQAADYVGKKRCVIGQVCRGIGKTAGGYYWAYYDKSNEQLLIPEGHYFS